MKLSVKLLLMASLATTLAFAQNSSTSSSSSRKTARPTTCFKIPT